MHGNLNEIDIRSILQLISLGQRTGQLLVEESFHNSDKLTNHQTARHQNSWNDENQFWFVFFLNGQIIYCQQGDADLSRIDDYLHHYRIENVLNEQQLASLGSQNAPEYGYLWELLERNIIDPKVAHSIIHRLVYETLFDLLSLHQGSFIFRQGATLSPQLTSLEIAPLVYQITQQIQEWKQLYPHIQSAEQLPILADMVQLQSSLPAATINKLQHWADGKKTLRQLARHLNRDILTVAKAIYPYVEQGWLQLIYSNTVSPPIHRKDSEVNQQYKGRVVCIDDTKTICETIESILKPQGYDAIALTNPLEAISLIFKLQPDLILCDIAMPNLDGYEICAMLRHSRAFQNIPIIILTAQDKFIDRVRATMVGATDYLTKPFGDTELLMLVEKYINVSSYLGTPTTPIL
ncbi:response regulator [Nodularia harveyana UHCC-0300]|uniref:Protein PatA n=1 Tax=Nodularia harveyana UHCC-0300 TaxID=2974287 RepID=A0ABU5U9J8_9CYAN|nr:response regulator [Nodularia harveyana]MEA5580063.1 response regulator [Nodularia harveyana UHCC-0300]